MESPSDFTGKIVQFPLFKELEKDPAALKDLAQLMKYETFQVRDFLIDEKQSDSRLFLLLNGQVEINKIDENGQIVVLGKADSRSFPCFGESVLFGNFRRTANVVAWTHCECLSLQAQDFEAFTARHPYIVASFFRSLSKTLFERLARADKDVFIASLMLKK